MRSYILLVAFTVLTIAIATPVGYEVTNVSSYTILRSSGRSTLYQVQSPGIKDGRPLKLLKLVGSHYQVGYDYGVLLGSQIVFTYNTFMNSFLPNKWKLHILEMFLDWQFNSYVVKQMQPEFQEQLLGLRDAGYATKIYILHRLVKRTLVVSSYPGNIGTDIKFALLEEFIRAFTPKKKNDQSMFGSLVENKKEFTEFYHEFMETMKIHCSFFAVWGNRTEGSKIYTMRNLDWNENTGVNKNKIIFVYKIDNEIPHLTLGYPGVLGALTGMSAAGLTVHEAGLDTHKQTELGSQWTLRLRYVMGKARNLGQAQAIWRGTNNTLGMNHMIASGNSVDQKAPALVMETMAGYTAFFRDHDSRQDKTKFIDPNTSTPYIAGYSMPQAVFRTNHGYDPTIRKHLVTPMPAINSSTMIRYFLLKDGFEWYEKNRKITAADALNMTAILGNKGSQEFKVCPQKDIGTNVISVMYSPEDLKMWASFEYNFGKDFRPACCGVYLEIDMKLWFRLGD